MKASVFAVDVGYGNTKSAFRMGSNIATQMFPSLTPIHVSNRLSEQDGGVSKINIKPITIDGTTYDVGPQVPLTSVHGNSARTLVEDFCTTPRYAALLGGSLAYAGISSVERLVLGLPVHTVKKFAASVRDSFQRTMDFGHGSIKIESVKVVPQPLGSLISFSEYGGVRFEATNAHLIIDVGYFTTDWIVANGFTVDDSRSGGAPGGASHVYKHIANAIGEQEGEPAPDIERVDASLRDKTPLQYAGKRHDLLPFLQRSDAVISQTVTTVKEIVGHGLDLTSIVLTGGGATLYEAAVRAAYPRIPVQVLDAPCFANVKGFLIVGEMTLARERKASGAVA